MREPSFWNDAISKSMTKYANMVFIVLWVGFVIALLVNQEWLDGFWDRVQGLPLLPKFVV